MIVMIKEYLIFFSPIIVIIVSLFPRFFMNAKTNRVVQCHDDRGGELIVGAEEKFALGGADNAHIRKFTSIF